MHLVPVDNTLRTSKASGMPMEDGPYVQEAKVVLPGSKGVQVGDSNRQVNQFFGPFVQRQVFPGSADLRASVQPRAVWGNVPAKNQVFTGRAELLADLRARFLAIDGAAVCALYGMSGVGKTQVAAEYAHRFGDEYEVVWWMSAERAGLVGEQFAELADALGLVQAGAGLGTVRRAVFSWLRSHNGWLVVFDNAEDPEVVANWLPGGNGHVLITSRELSWEEIAVPVEIDVFGRDESVELLVRRVPKLDAAEADRVAEALGDWPLALAQAAGFMAETGMPAAEYRELLATRAVQLLGHGRPSSYPRSLAAVTQLAFDQISADDQAAAQLVALCAFLAPFPLPEAWFVSSLPMLASPLAERAADPLEWRHVIRRLGRNALVRVDPEGLQMHRVTQAIVRSHLAPEEASVTRRQAAMVLVAAKPGDTRVPANWPMWARLLPHVLALGPEADSIRQVRNVAGAAAWYATRRGDVRTGHDLARKLYGQWRDQLGADHIDTLWAASALTYALREMGLYATARELDEDTLNRRLSMFGEGHDATLSSAASLADDLRGLGNYEAARDLDELTLTRARRVLGDDHPSTLEFASFLADDLRGLGDFQSARDVDEDTLARKRQTLGEDHPSVFTSTASLAASMRALGDARGARELDFATFAWRRRVLGEDHPSTLASATDLADDLFALGEYEDAREIDEDTLTRRQRVLGQDHPKTLVSASNLSRDLQRLAKK
jgi:hypothetical protein